MWKQLQQHLQLGTETWRELCREARRVGRRPDQHARDVGKISEAELLSLYAETLGIAAAEPGRTPLRPAGSPFVERVPVRFCREQCVMGLAQSDTSELSPSEPRPPVPVATADPLDWATLDEVARLVGRAVEPVLAGREEIQAAINLGYQQQSGSAALMGQTLAGLSLGERASAGDRGRGGAAKGDALSGSDARREAAELVGSLGAMGSLGSGRAEDLLDIAGKPPVIRLVNLVLFEAVRQRASDVHLQPTEDALQVRFRIDGVLHDFFALPKPLQDALISRVKVMARMNVAERRLPQDGRAAAELGERPIDLRVSSVPGAHGERVVMRLLDRSARTYDLETLGMLPDTLGLFSDLVARPYGIMLVTGPTGSGKSTTLYAALSRLNNRELNIMTLEDPIEYQLPGISQMQVSNRKGMTFASGLRHVLRQDPDVIMVGEVRDGETARMAVQSSLTGHMVFSTLHTNDSAGAVARMIDLGVEPYLVAGSLVGVLAQRLVRQVCRECKKPSPVGPDATAVLGELGEVGRAAEELWAGAGCEHCLGTGYRDRLGIFELLTIDDGLRELINSKTPAGAIRQAALAAGLVSLRQDGLRKVLLGRTTLSEVLGETPLDG